MARHSAIILVKTWRKSVEWCRWYSTCFSVFPGDTFSTWKMETKLCGNLRSGRTIFNRIRVPRSKSANNYQTDWAVFEKTGCVFHSTWKSWKMEQNLGGGKTNLYRLPLTGLKIRLNFATIYSRLRDQFAQPFKEIKRRGKIRYRETKPLFQFAPLIQFDDWFYHLACALYKF